MARTYANQQNDDPPDRQNDLRGKRDEEMRLVSEVEFQSLYSAVPALAGASSASSTSASMKAALGGVAAYTRSSTI